MTQALSLVSQGAQVPGQSQGQLTREQIELVKRTIAVGATDDELQLFLYTAKRLGLDPLSKQIHFVKRKRKNYDTGQYEDTGTIQVGIDGFRIIAERTGKLAGIKRGVIQDDKGRLVAGWAEVYRADWKEPAREEAPFTEYCQVNSNNKPVGLWARMPETMIKKCAEAAALRMAFPADLSGVYSDEEMMQADIELPQQKKVFCQECGQEITPSEKASARHIADFARKHFGKVLCTECMTPRIEAIKTNSCSLKENSGELNWPRFWTTVKDYGFDNEQVHVEARCLFAVPDIKSLKEVLKTEEEMNEFLDYLKTLHEFGSQN